MADRPVAREIPLGGCQVVGVVEEAEDAAAFAGDGDAHGGVGRAEEHVVARADDVPDVGVDDASVADDGDPLGGAG